MAAGARLALRDAGGRAGGRRLRLVELPSTEPGDPDWDPGLVEANAKRAADDPRSIAYVGEVDRGASAVSVPRTNRAELLQVSPLDGLTSLTRSPPGRPRAGPERYYPDERRSFVRLVPPDARIARADAGAGARPARGAGSRWWTPRTSRPRELGAVLDAEVRRRTIPRGPHAAQGRSRCRPRRGRRAGAGPAPDVVLVSGEPGPVARVLLAELGRRLPRRAGDRLARAGRHGRRGQRCRGGHPRAARVRPARARAGACCGGWAGAGRPEALYGYDAMALVLAAVRDGAAAIAAR